MIEKAEGLVMSLSAFTFLSQQHTESLFHVIHFYNHLTPRSM